MKKLLFLSLLSLFFTTAVTIAANSRVTATTRHDVTKHEISGATQSAFLFGNGTNIAALVGYAYTIAPPIQLSVSSAFGYSKVLRILGSDIYTTSLVVLAGPTLNIPFTEDISNAFFITGVAGITYASISGLSENSSSTKFTFGFSAGKRFQIFENVSYKPSAGLVKVTDTNTDIVFAISPLAFSILF